MPDQMAERRVVELSALLQFLQLESIKVRLPRKLDGRSVRRARLDDYLASAVAPPCPAGNLHNQLEGALGRTEILHMQRLVRINQPDQGDIGKVQALGDHLRSNQQVDPAPPEVPENLPEKVFLRHGVRVHPHDIGPGQDLLHHVLDLLRSLPAEPDAGSAALRAVLRGSLLRRAEVAT